MKPIFTSEDFEECRVYDPPDKAAAILANYKLEKLIKSWPVVRGYVGEYGSSWSSAPKGTYIQEKDTHRARLAFIEELPKEPCKHEPEPIYLYGASGNYAFNLTGVRTCKHCKAEIVAEWKAK